MLGEERFDPAVVGQPVLGTGKAMALVLEQEVLAREVLETRLSATPTMRYRLLRIADSPELSIWLRDRAWAS